MMKNLFGDEAEVLLEELLNQGQDSASNLIFRSVQRLREVLEGITLKCARINAKYQQILYF